MSITINFLSPPVPTDILLFRQPGFGDGHSHDIPTTRLRIHLHHYQTRTGETFEQIANRIGTSKMVLSNWSRGINSPPMTALLRLAMLFGVQFEDLVGRV